MSLLIDALRQADATRRHNEQADAQQTSSDANAELRLEPMARNALNTRGTTGPASTAAPDRDAPMRAATRDLFDAKRAPQQRPTLLVALLAIVVALLCLGTGYYWWMTRPRGMQPGAALRTPTATPAIVATTPPPALASDGRDTAPASTDAHSQPSAMAETATALPRTESPPRPTRQSAEALPTGSRSVANRAQTPREVPLPAPTEEGIEPATVLRTQPAQPDAATAPISQAYAAYQMGDYARARSLYLQVLRSDSHNADALLALGSIALHDNQPAAAARYLRDAVEADPSNATARSQLALLQADADPVAAESRLRTLLAAQPANAATQFALGSVLARQQRWNEAQQAFFQAYTLDSDNPDILYNLAVSLDQLRQPALAREYYEQALRAAQRRPASFDTIQATQRVHALAPAPNR
ncbi:tetratricopeptide repeat protein [Uliginosibacterium sp. sgz301328]|uniref:tetratricopeptide repeat protein n=1 Tax=Uliginosibacterium sp. sgz301328 TaxID=3243764 RepID=UPI00359EB2E9